MNRCYLAPILVFVSPLVASAGTLTQFVEINNGLYDNPADGFRTWAMRVTADTDWKFSALQIDLDSGSLAHIAPTFLATPVELNNFGDTAGHAPTLVNADLTRGFHGRVAFDGEQIETPTSFRSVWFTTQTDDIGTFDVAMITLSPDAHGEIRFRTISDFGQVEEGGFSVGTAPLYQIENGCIGRHYASRCVPEPTSLALLVTTCLLTAVVRSVVRCVL